MLNVKKIVNLGLISTLCVITFSNFCFATPSKIKKPIPKKVVKITTKKVVKPITKKNIKATVKKATTPTVKKVIIPAIKKTEVIILNPKRIYYDFAKIYEDTDIDSSLGRSHISYQLFKNLKPYTLSQEYKDVFIKLYMALEKNNGDLTKFNIDDWNFYYKSAKVNTNLSDSEKAIIDEDDKNIQEIYKAYVDYAGGKIDKLGRETSKITIDGIFYKAYFFSNFELCKKFAQNEVDIKQGTSDVVEEPKK